MSLLSKLPVPTIIPALSGTPTASVIILHGLGASGSDFVGLVDGLQRGANESLYEHIEFVLPQAPTIPISANGMYQMPAWFDLYEFGKSLDDYKDIKSIKGDYEGVMNTLKIVDELVELQMSKGIKSERIVLGGFSQGAAISYAYLATSKYKLGGGIIMSGFNPIPYDLQKHFTDTNKDTPIVQFHGTEDPIIKYDVGLFTRDYYRSNVGFSNIKFFKYNGMQHSTCPDEVEKIYDFINQVVPKK